MWLTLAFLSATLLGLYDIAKKTSLRDNAVLPVLLLNTVFSTLIFLPFIIISHTCGADTLGQMFYVPEAGWTTHRLIIIKAMLTLASWICGYFAIKHLPLTIAGPINATRPVMVLVGAMLVFGERLNVWQWTGTAFAVVSFFLLSISGKREGIDFRHNKWIFLLIAAAIFGAASGLYDKYLMQSIAPMTVQSWFNIYQMAMMTIIVAILWLPARDRGRRFEWRWSIVLISLFLSAADFVYYYALSCDGSMVSIISMVRRSSVIVSFTGGVLLFHEHNIRYKVIDLAMVLAGMVFLYIGS